MLRLRIFTIQVLGLCTAFFSDVVVCSTRSTNCITTAAESIDKLSWKSSPWDLGAAENHVHELIAACVSPQEADVLMQAVHALRTEQPGVSDGSSTSSKSGGARAAVIAPAVVVPAAVLLAAVVALALWASRRRRQKGGVGFSKVKPPTDQGTTLIVTDIEGSTDLWDTLDSRVMDRVLQLHHATIRAVCLKHRGYESATEGDSFVLAFDNPHRAVLFSVDVQDALMECDWPAELLAVPECAPVFVEPQEGGADLGGGGSMATPPAPTPAATPAPHANVGLSFSLSFRSALRGHSFVTLLHGGGGGGGEERNERRNRSTGNLVLPADAQGAQTMAPLTRFSIGLKPSPSAPAAVAVAEAQLEESDDNAGDAVQHHPPSPPHTRQAAGLFLPQQDLRLPQHIPKRVRKALQQSDSTRRSLMQGAAGANRLQVLTAPADCKCCRPQDTTQQLQRLTEPGVGVGVDGATSDAAAASGQKGWAKQGWLLGGGVLCLARASLASEPPPCPPTVQPVEGRALSNGLPLPPPPSVEFMATLGGQVERGHAGSAGAWRGAMILPGTRSAASSLHPDDVMSSAPGMSSDQPMPLPRLNTGGSMPVAATNADDDSRSDGACHVEDRNGADAMFDANDTKHIMLEAPSGSYAAKSLGGRVLRNFPLVDGPGPGRLMLFRGLRVRIGMHTGMDEPGNAAYSRTAGRMQYTGAFSASSRIVQNAAPGGLTLLCEHTKRALGAAFEQDKHVVVAHVGEHVLGADDTQRLVHLYAVFRTHQLPRLVYAQPIRSLPSPLASPGILGAPYGEAVIAYMHVVGLSSLQAHDLALAARCVSLYRCAAEGELCGTPGGYLVEESDGLMLAAFTSAGPALQWALGTMQRCLAVEWPQELLAHEAGEVVVAPHPTHPGAAAVSRQGTMSNLSAHNPTTPSAVSATATTVSASGGSVVMRGLRLKCGLDIGKVSCAVHPVLGRVTYRGRVMNRAARISGAARTGQVWCSSSLWSRFTNEQERERGAGSGVSHGPVGVQSQGHRRASATTIPFEAEAEGGMLTLAHFGDMGHDVKRGGESIGASSRGDTGGGGQSRVQSPTLLSGEQACVLPPGSALPHAVETIKAVPQGMFKLKGVSGKQLLYHCILSADDSTSSHTQPTSPPAPLPVSLPNKLLAAVVTALSHDHTNFVNHHTPASPPSRTRTSNTLGF